MAVTNCVSSGEKTSSALIVTGACELCGVLAITNGTADATIIVYDNTAGSGTKLVELFVAGENNSDSIIFPQAVAAGTGLYVSVAGTGASAIVYYRNAW